MKEQDNQDSMIKSVWKYRLATHGKMLLRVPEGALPLWISAVGSDVFIWMEVEPEKPKETRKFLSFMTGEHFEKFKTMLYRGTAIFSDEGAPYIIHIYEEMALTGNEIRESQNREEW